MDVSLMCLCGLGDVEDRRTRDGPRVLLSSCYSRVGPSCHLCHVVDANSRLRHGQRLQGYLMSA